MTDRFEDAVRDAARGLSAGSNDLPTYHDAWQRGRRRRIMKRSAFAAAGVFIFVAALSVNLGRFPGSDSTETDDVAVAVEAVATPLVEPTPLPTTAQVESPESAAPPVVAIPTAPVVPTQDTPTPIPTATVAPTAEAATAAQPTAEPTAAPTAVATPVESPTPEPAVPEPTREAVTPDPEPTVPRESDPPLSSTPPDETGATSTSPAELPPAGGTPEDGSPQAPEVAFTTAGVGQPASAIVLEPIAEGQLACDITGDGTADAQCELLPNYGCVADTEAQPGYVALDTDEDGSIDTCSAVGITVCDTSADGLGDTPCIIEIDDTIEDDEAPIGDE